MKTMNVFVYGTLMFDRVWSALIAKRYRRIDAQLAGFERLAVKGEVYPGLLKADGSIVDGVLVLDVDDMDVRVLDRFEGEMYARVRVYVELSNNSTIAAQAYVVREKFWHRLDPIDWDLDEFIRNGKERFKQSYQGFQSL